MTSGRRRSIRGTPAPSGCSATRPTRSSAARATILFTPEDRAAGVPERELADARARRPRRRRALSLRKDGSRFYCSGVTTRLGEARRSASPKIARDLTAAARRAMALQDAHDELEHRVDERTRELAGEASRRTTAQEHVTSLLRRLVTAQEDERARIARDLHDQLGQQLTALRLTLERARDGRRRRPTDDLERAVALAEQIDRELDFLAWELRPAVLDDLGLAAALPRFLRRMVRASPSLAAEFRVDRLRERRSCRATPRSTFYRVAQEALNNVVKHAHATRVDVDPRDARRRGRARDRGRRRRLRRRATRDRRRSGIGLAGMRERAALIGASLDIESAPGKGTTVFLRLPVAAPGERATDG